MDSNGSSEEVDDVSLTTSEEVDNVLIVTSREVNNVLIVTSQEAEDVTLVTSQEADDVVILTSQCLPTCAFLFCLELLLQVRTLYSPKTDSIIFS